MSTEPNIMKNVALIIKRGILCFLSGCALAACLGLGTSTISVQGTDCGEIWVIGASSDIHTPQEADCFSNAYQNCSQATLAFSANDVDVSYRWGIVILPHKTLWSCPVEFTELKRTNVNPWSSHQAMCERFAKISPGLAVYCGQAKYLFDIYCTVSPTTSPPGCWPHDPSYKSPFDFL
jgi:hypothetical protein